MPLERFIALPILILLTVGCASSPNATGRTVKDWPYRTYHCPRAMTTPVIDGDLDDAAWHSAPWTDEFVDIQRSIDTPPRHATRTKMTWDDEHFYFAATMVEPHIWATFTQRDSIIYHENDFEVFIDPDGDTNLYAELEVNALNTVWDLLLVRPYRDGGPALHEWDIPGLKTAVSVDGTINDPSDTDRGWTVEIAIPWQCLKPIAGVDCPPKPGDRWRLNFSRVQWRIEPDPGVDGNYRKSINPATSEPYPEDNWVWSPQRAIAMHEPEYWGFVIFEDARRSHGGNR